MLLQWQAERILRSERNENLVIFLAGLLKYRAERLRLGASSGRPALSHPVEYLLIRDLGVDTELCRRELQIRGARAHAIVLLGLPQEGWCRELERPSGQAAGAFGTSSRQWETLQQLLDALFGPPIIRPFEELAVLVVDRLPVRSELALVAVHDDL